MRYKFVGQHDASDCAAACLAMICSYYGKETIIAKLRDSMGTDLKGTNLVGIQKCAEELGFVSQAVRVDEEGFFSEYPLPAIANIITPKGLSHFVVIFQICKEKILIGNPAKEIVSIKKEEFFQDFTGILMLLQPGDKFKAEKKKNGSLVKSYMKLLYPQRKLFFQGMVASLFMSAFGILNSMFYYVVYDEILPGKKEDVLTLVLLVFLGVLVVQTGIKMIRQWIMTRLSINIDFPLMSEYFQHIYRLPMKFFATRKTGDITTRFSDAFTIKDIFTNIVPALCIDGGMAVISGSILYQLNVSLFVVVLGISAASVVGLMAFQKVYKRLKEEGMEQAGVVTSRIIEGIQGIETIKSSVGEENELRNLREEYKKSLEIAYQESKISNIQSGIMDLISGGGTMLLIYLGICQVMEGTISLGSMMAFMTLSGWFMEPLQRFVQLQLSIKKADISMKRMIEIMEYEGEQDLKNNCVELEEITGEIGFQNVSFRYGNGSEAIKNVSFQIEAGKKVALVGASGSGKSTIAKLLMKYYELEEGSIVINHRDIREYSHTSLRKAIGYVPQKIELFSKSIYENIALVKEKSTMKEVEEAAKKAGAHEFISRLPRKYNTYLEEAGNGLSGGEKQKIALARAFLKKSKFYILDESTSNLDFLAESEIFQRIYQEFRDSSMLIIAHRLSTIKECDEILVMEQGKIVERGTHKKLLEQKGCYYKLWKIQEGK